METSDKIKAIKQKATLQRLHVREVIQEFRHDGSLQKEKAFIQDI
ncbi:MULTISPECIES: hypothetical protein [Sanguibacteroides]|nr:MULTISPECIES: hypothetical protein [Sanguibacteroides]